MQRGMLVTQTTADEPIEYEVRRVHRDGTVTIRARFHLDRNENCTGPFLGMLYRVDPGALRPLH